MEYLAVGIVIGLGSAVGLGALIQYKKKIAAK